MEIGVNGALPNADAPGLSSIGTSIHQSSNIRGLSLLRSRLLGKRSELLASKHT